ncbi:hypothetical protein HER10_EVM0011855 [Colletotrichum scovillei]|uniref:uncharacterized protein n=1 Tax=Colletotrichum scovillei TaxID=1209932 RepID=UPI0015C360F9|nr:uncharacterized protein HER10_EVM0011855 [Colletotrichum scovillei]KAF4774339.1 hypothetical protein HER10_EVM0011855 [Colletotrichum scovillei]
MRASFRTVVLVTVVGLPFFATGVTASASANDLKQRDKVESYAAALKVEHHARSPQDPNAFTSYDYGYTYPPPPSPTSYGDQPPSTVISSANSDYASSTEVGSVASDSSTYGVSDSVTLSLTTSAGVTATLSNAVTYSPSSDGTSRTVSSKPDRKLDVPPRHYRDSAYFNCRHLRNRLRHPNEHCCHCRAMVPG